uniref:Endo/exonuclease/phosphatase domain-containing protein n=1 Tax=Heligmosomoides polygyrus TaxID=6339 RepID=A0A183FQC7_HELPZ
LQATGTCDRPAYEDPVTSHGVCQLTFFEIVLRLPPTRTRKARRVWKQDLRSNAECGYVGGPLCELVEALELRRVDFCAVQETRWSCSKSRDIGRSFKAVLCGSPRTTSGLGIIVSERFREPIVSVERFDDRLMKIVVAAKERLYHFSAYAPQNGCSEQCQGCHDGFGYGFRNADGERILEYAESYNLIIVNTNRDRSIVTDAKVAPQHRPLICSLKISHPRQEQVERCGWRMREKKAAVISRVWLPTVTTVDKTWKMAADVIRQAAQPERHCEAWTTQGRQAGMVVDRRLKAKVREKKSLFTCFSAKRPPITGGSAKRRGKLQRRL